MDVVVIGEELQMNMNINRWPNWSDKEEQARKLAEFIHHGQKRNDGEDYIKHPERVAIAIKKLGYDEDTVCAALLHDSEDFPHLNILFSLIDRVFGSKVFGIVLVLTHVKGVGLEYEEYIDHISNYPVAVAIKLEDIIDNTKRRCGDKQLKKYKDAVLYFKSKGIEIPEVLMDTLKI